MIGIDLGSNTFRVVLIECKSKEILAQYEKIVRTAYKLHETGFIQEESIVRIIDACQEAKNHIDFSNQPIFAVTTQAVRIATNQQEVLRRIKESCGIQLRIIDGHEEAMLTLHAVQSRLKHLHTKSDRFILIDLGGASTEISFVDRDQVRSQSFPIGIVTMAEKYHDVKSLKDYLTDEFIEVKDFIVKSFTLHGKPDLLVATAGTPTTLKAFTYKMEYDHYDSQRINGSVLTLEEVDQAFLELLAMEQMQRVKYVGVGREELIMTGIILLKELFFLLDFQEALVIDDGLREGAALRGCEEQVQN